MSRRCEEAGGDLAEPEEEQDGAHKGDDGGAGGAGEAGRTGAAGGGEVK